MMKELTMSDAYLPGDTRQRIQDLIKNRKITQAELAEKVGLSNSALSRYLQGSTKNLGDGFIIRIAKYFDVSTDFLLGETDIPDRKNYDIEELGLSAETAKLLYTGKVDASVLNQLIEHQRFPQLLLLLARHRDETMIAGINAMNQVLTFSGPSLSARQNFNRKKQRPPEKLRRIYNCWALLLSRQIRTRSRIFSCRSYAT